MNISHLGEYDKKLLIKVIAGLIVLVIAFTMFLIKNNENNNIVISDENKNQTNSELSGQEGDIVSSKSTEKTSPSVINIYIDVAGAVNRPSVVTLEPESRVFEAIAQAGGLTKDADTRETNLARVVSDGEKIYIPTKKEMENRSINTGSNGSIGSGQSTGSQVSALININTADSETLQELTGVGPSTAEKIINYREEYGSFTTIEDLKNVSGIGDKTFNKFKNKITV